MYDWVKWFFMIIVIGFFVLLGGYMIGSAVHDQKKQGVDLSIECIKAGGNPVTNVRDNTFECRK
jgi:hypothetical protein